MNCTPIIPAIEKNIREHIDLGLAHMVKAFLSRLTALISSKTIPDTNCLIIDN